MIDFFSSDEYLITMHPWYQRGFILGNTQTPVDKWTHREDFKDVSDISRSVFWPYLGCICLSNFLHAFWSSRSQSATSLHLRTPLGHYQKILLITSRRSFWPSRYGIGIHIESNLWMQITWIKRANYKYLNIPIGIGKLVCLKEKRNPRVCSSSTNRWIKD